MVDVENTNTLVSASVCSVRLTRPVWTRRPGNFSEGLPVEEIRRELSLMLASSDFPASERNRRVLQYIVECALQERVDDISAYHIATRVYGRGENFDAVTDPIVRIEVSRLRRDLEMYYLKAGRLSPLCLSIPKGRYFPKVARATSDKASVSPFLVVVLRVSLCAWSGAQDAAAAAWQDLLLADPALLANLQASVIREVGDEEVVKMIVEGVLRAARKTT
jgi:hypothetical protein